MSIHITDWFISLVVILLIPWSVRNYIAYDGIVLINTRTMDLRPEGKSENTWQKRIDENVKSLGSITHVTVSNTYPSNHERELIKSGNDNFGRTIEEQQAIRNNIYPDSTFLSRKLYWFKEFWRIARFKAEYFPFPDARFQGMWSLKHNVSSILCYGLLLPFVVVGLFVMYSEKNRALLFLAFPIVIQTLLHMLQWSRDRYRIPIDAFIIIIAVFGMFWCYVKFTKHYSETKKRRLL